jgi:hypothetical protein
MCVASKVGVWRVNRHVAWSPLACASTDMCRAATCVRARRVDAAIACGMWGWRAGATVACGAGAVLFLYGWSAFAWEPCMQRKIAVTPAAACSRERALLAHATEGAGHAGGCSALGRARRRR